MIQYRAFLNNDTPLLVDVWQSEPPQRALAQPVTAAMLEQFVFSKLYFDRHGLIVAEEVAADDTRRVVGFAHAGFGPDAEATWIGHDVGVVSMLMVRPRDDEDRIARELLERCEQFLQAGGAPQIYAGGCYPHSPYYVGLYGGCELAGILASDERRTRWVKAAGYGPQQTRQVLNRSLAELRPVSNRQQLMIRRRCRLETVLDPRPASWWEANRAAQHDFTRFQLVPLQGGDPLAWITVWDLEPLAGTWGVHAAGLLDIGLGNDRCEEGVDTFLLCESLRQLQSLGVTVVEAHVGANDANRQRLLREVGFEDVDEGVVYGKTIGA